MSDPVELAIQEVRDWKRQAAEATRGMSAEAVIEFYRKQADEVQQKLGIHLTSQPAAARRARSPRR
jgi:hypothetical protein